MRVGLIQVSGAYRMIKLLPYLFAVITLTTTFPSFSDGRENVPGLEIQALHGEYAGRIRTHILDALNSFSLSKDFVCTLHVSQLPGGEIMKVSFSGCDAPPDQQEKMSKRLMGVKLPYRGFEAVFRRELVIHFYPEEH